jgi:Na+/H+ antiporter NhaC
LVGFANLAIANTVSIVIGPIAKEINDEYDLNPKKDSRYFRYLFCELCTKMHKDTDNFLSR